MRDVGARVRAIFDRLFPERQIIQRSCGAVRGLKLSPGRQALAGLCAAGFAGWCVYATTATVFEGPCPQVVLDFEEERARYVRWLDDFRGRSAHAREVLEHSTMQFERARRIIDTRHAVLRALLEQASGARPEVPASDPADVLAGVLGEVMAPVHVQHRAEPVSLSAITLRSRLGDRHETSQAPEQPAMPRQADFVAYIHDHRVADRVNAVAARVSAFHRLTNYH